MHVRGLRPALGAFAMLVAAAIVPRPASATGPFPIATMHPAVDTVEISGTVVDSVTAQPLRGADVRIARGGVLVASATTDGAGRFAVRVADGSYLVEVRSVGYRLT